MQRPNYSSPGRPVALWAWHCLVYTKLTWHCSINLLLNSVKLAASLPPSLELLLERFQMQAFLMTFMLWYHMPCCAISLWPGSCWKRTCHRCTVHQTLSHLFFKSNNNATRVKSFVILASSGCTACQIGHGIWPSPCLIIILLLA